MEPTPILDGFHNALLFEFDIAERQLLGLGTAFPADRYGWRPDTTARSVSEVLVHVAAGNFFLLHLAGHTPPQDLIEVTLT
jgi:hypothetical protein